MQSDIPDKLYFKIGEVSKLAQVPPHVLRYWETEFKGIKPKRAGSKQRLYRREDVELILKIKSLLHEQGYTIAGARKLLENDTMAGTPVPDQAAHRNQDRSSLSQALGAIKSELQRLQQLISKKR